MRKGLTVFLFGISIALIVAVAVVGVAAAQAPTPAGPGGFHGVVVAKAAAILGVSEAKLNDALTQGHSQALDDAVKAGSLTQTQADWMKQRHAAMQQGGFGPGMMGGGMMGGRGMMGGGRFGPPAQPTR
jgi:hypothetical protein